MDNDIIDISMDFDNVDTDFQTPKGSFGGGIELLMNDRKKPSGGPSSDIDISDLNKLESELNDLAADSAPPQTSFTSNLFGRGDSSSSVRFGDVGESPSNLGKSTSDTFTDAKTYDGYGRFNDIPMNPDTPVMNTGPKLSKEELLKEKFKYLRKLENLEKKGVELTKKYSMDSNLNEMQGEYEMVMEEKNRSNSVKFQANMMMSAINGLEYLNGKFDPFDINIDGLGEQIGENISDYDDVFGELYDKYKTKASLAPELKLLFQLGGAGIMVHMTNSMFKTAMPGMDDILKQNPELMRQFQTAAVNSMAGSNPGFSGFMSGVMDPAQQQGSSRGPPPTVQTQGMYAAPPPADRGGNNVRPDISMARTFADDGISFKEHSQGGNEFIEPPQPSQKSSRRPEMKGPSDIGDILSGLKTKTINISAEKEQSRASNNTSTISIEDLKDIQGSGNIPKRSRRRPKSDKNTVSLDI